MSKTFEYVVSLFHNDKSIFLFPECKDLLKLLFNNFDTNYFYFPNESSQIQKEKGLSSTLIGSRYIEAPDKFAMIIS